MLTKELLENHNKNKIQKPDCTTRTGRSLLAFYLQTKFKQIINYDKKSEKQILVDYKSDFLDNFTNRLINRPKDKILIALSGESASGKSTICSNLVKCINKLNLPISVVSADNYFKDISDLINKYGSFDLVRDSGYDVDSPDNFDLQLLKEDLLQLQKGIDILSPQYLVNGTGKSKPKSIPVKSNKIVLVEGICSTFEDIRDVFDIKIYIDLDENERKNRFLKRAKERNQDEINAQKHWEYIKEAGKKYVICNKQYCDIIINGECNENYFANIIEYIYLVTNNFCEE